jgi:hypothetical protein
MEHDNAYWIGGTEEDRLWADRELYWCMREWEVPMEVAAAYYIAVQQFGRSSFTHYSWRSRKGEMPPDPVLEWNYRR